MNKNGGINNLHLKDKSEIEWNCEKGHYLDGKKLGDWKRDKNTVIKHHESCSDFDRMRANYAFAKKYKDEMMETIRKSKPLMKTDPDQYWKNVDAAKKKFDDEMYIGRVKDGKKPTEAKKKEVKEDEEDK